MSMDIKYRRHIFETNSSSSHTFSVGKEKRFKSNLKIVDGKIILPEIDWSSEELGKESTNIPEEKLCFLLTQIYCRFGKWNIEAYEYEPTEKVNEVISVVKKVVCEFTGAEEVVYKYISPVDHDSLELIDSRDMTNPEFIKEFVFNENTYLYLSWDHAPEYVENNDLTTPFIRLTYDFPGLGERTVELSRMDLSLYDPTKGCFGDITYSSKTKLFSKSEPNSYWTDYSYSMGAVVFSADDITIKGDKLETESELLAIYPKNVEFI